MADLAGGRIWEKDSAVPERAEVVVSRDSPLWPRPSATLVGVLPLQLNSIAPPDPVMETVIIHFEHDTRDLMDYFDARTRMRQILSVTRSGEYVQDDMAIDGGDCETILRGPSASKLFNDIVPVLRELSFLRGAKVTFIYGSLDSGAPATTFQFEG